MKFPWCFVGCKQEVQRLWAAYWENPWMLGCVQTSGPQRSYRLRRTSCRPPESLGGLGPRVQRTSGCSLSISPGWSWFWFCKKFSVGKPFGKVDFYVVSKCLILVHMAFYQTEWTDWFQVLTEFSLQSTVVPEKVGSGLNLKVSVYLRFHSRDDQTLEMSGVSGHRWISPCSQI